jgi:phytol kinase
MSGDLSALVLSYLYVTAIVGLAELIRRRAGFSVDFTRKVVHVGVGVWIVPTLLLFDDWRWAIVPPATFVALNLLSYRKSLVGAMEEADKSNLGTILFPIAFIVLIAWLWPMGRFDAIAGGILVLALGDAAAALVGRRFGRTRYRVGSSTRTAEGTAAMIVFSVAALVAATSLFESDVSTPALLGVAALAGGLEGVSVRGLDNLVVPVGTAAALLAVG